ncbi:co-chaperone YbbN [Halomonas cupida]|uniref:Co-chaperone YbbN n=1 Tax=Halomonas cupida TaxID=44933 RepID=A0A1M7E716_9GAMM|nr:tetratricopeptide repeat protein [Halomonas cupida]GEN22822.1 co-chaperone YbbN [Halomonas cupida]SHL87169.1 putative thioredoxin [Halomonas cupida]
MPIVDPRSGEPISATPEAGAQQPSQQQAQAPADSDLIFDVDRSNIQQVLELSTRIPVLLDCWAPWCEPCKNLMPVLEKLVREYRGTFLLAKLNIDDNQDIAAQLGVRSVPDVKLISQGGLVDQFQGALPEKEIREWLGRYFPAPEDAPASPEELAEQALANGDTDTALGIYQELSQQYPEHYAYQIQMARTLVSAQRNDEARALLDALPPEERDAPAARGVRASIEFSEEAPSQDDLAAMESRDDSEANYLRALRKVADGDYENGLPGLLAVMKSDRAYGDDLARKTLLRVFDALGADHPLTVDYRRKLFALLY